tara:strand:- start:104 stop:724 length:621 start_codon:yes stop_codon:yes gene_type:complete
MVNEDFFENSRRRRSALNRSIIPGRYGNITFKGPGVFLTERHPISIIQIETIKEKNLSALNNLSKCLEIVFSEEPNLSNGDKGLRILWTGPGRWLIVEPETRDLFKTVVNELERRSVAITDLSHGRTSLRLSGQDSRELLMKGSGLDWHLNAFTQNNCAQTKLFNLSALIDCRDYDTFDLYIARGFALDFWQSLNEAAEEFGCEVY